MGRHVILFGGTFDPVHHGHLIVARALAEQRSYERITFVPSACPPHKTAAQADAADRLAMLQLAIAGEDRFDVSNIELRRGGPSYTLDTVRQLQSQLGPQVELHWVIGADMLADLAGWYRAAEVVESAGLIVAVRPPWDQRLVEIFEDLARVFTPGQVDRLRSAVVATPLIDISSSDIRRRVAAGLAIRYLVPQPVESYIRDRGLYR